VAHPSNLRSGRIEDHAIRVVAKIIELLSILYASNSPLLLVTWLDGGLVIWSQFMPSLRANEMKITPFYLQATAPDQCATYKNRP